jgi:hypothetical protein
MEKRAFFPYKGELMTGQKESNAKIKSYSYFMYLIPRYKWMLGVSKAPRLRFY